MTFGLVTGSAATQQACLAVKRLPLLLNSLQAEAGVSAEAFLDLEKALPKLLTASDDPHFKVSLAALAGIQV